MHFTTLFVFILTNHKIQMMNDEWILFLNEFRKTDSYRKSNGQLLFPMFFEWLSSNFEIPKKKQR